MAVEPGDANFQSQLDEKSRKRAREELNELNDKDRVLAVQSFRQWVLQQKWLKTPTDFGFLLRFLRARKFSQLEARENIENYWTVKSSGPHWFRDIDPSDPTLQEIMRTGFFISPKVHDSQGRRLFLDTIGKIDIDMLNKKWGVDNLFRAIGLICDWINQDENVQTNGLVALYDQTNITMGHVMTLFGRENGKRLVKFYQNALPCRVKGIQIYNEPAFFDALYALISPVLKQKLKDRMQFHGRSLVSVYGKIEQHMLPLEYLPDEYEGKSVGTVESCVEAMIADMNTPAFRSYIKNLSSDKYGVDLKVRTKDKANDVPEASFRKLNVD